MVRAAAFLLIGLTVTPAGAETASPDPLIGRVNHAGYNRHSHCTGFMVEGGHLVTAAHCMPRAERAVHYLAGYDRGQFSHHLEQPKSRFHSLPGRDIVILCNAGQDTSGRAISGEPPQPAQSVTVTGYASPRSQVLQARACDVVRAHARAIEIGCPLAPGNSGGPVTMQVDGGEQVVGVVSATSLHSGIAHRLSADDLAVCD